MAGPELSITREGVKQSGLGPCVCLPDAWAVQADTQPCYTAPLSRIHQKIESGVKRGLMGELRNTCDSPREDQECADPENHKVRQKLKAKEWDEFLAKGKRFRVLQPVKIGCVWVADGDCVDEDLKVLQQFAACFLETAPTQEEQTPKASKREKRDQQILAQLLPLLHGNVNGSKVIIREFQEHCRRGLLSKHNGSPLSPSATCLQTPAPGEDATVPSKSRLKRLISENSVYEKRPDFRMCWYVHPQVLRSFQQEHLPVPCQWSYVTTVPSAPREDSGGIPSTAPGQGTPVSVKRKSAGSMCITQFMKKRRHDGQLHRHRDMQNTTRCEAQARACKENECSVITASWVPQRHKRMELWGV
ncbi:Chromatin assembly factor 1, subunit A [Saguinus oedipus]|uniref:Chromatin assembly factor 1, subunit A n=1 Tax=Saguinus oedipus TaxID=9490 RepID=A0ABQ9TQM5_SAGOE|nr:Chromatin assembly factor 1, subunit A [Saguinus oedipus]